MLLEAGVNDSLQLCPIIWQVQGTTKDTEHLMTEDLEEVRLK